MDNLSDSQEEFESEDQYMESDPDQEMQEDFIASEEEGSDDQQEDSQDYQGKISELESRLEDQQMKFEDSYRNQQSNYDRMLAEMENKLQQYINNQQSSQDLLSNDDQYKDEYGDYRNLTPSEIGNIVQEQMKSYFDNQSMEQQKKQTEQQRRQQEDSNWVNSQPNSKEVMDYYNSNQANLERDFNKRGITDTKSMYFYVEAQIARNKNKPKRPKVPPVGNNGKSYASRPNQSRDGSELMQALARKRAEVRGGNRRR